MLHHTHCQFWRTLTLYAAKQRYMLQNNATLLTYT